MSQLSFQAAAPAMTQILHGLEMAQLLGFCRAYQSLLFPAERDDTRCEPTKPNCCKLFRPEGRESSV